jgi:hypothetical protein
MPLAHAVCCFRLTTLAFSARLKFASGGTAAADTFPVSSLQPRIAHFQINPISGDSLS